MKKYLIGLGYRRGWEWCLLWFENNNIIYGNMDKGLLRFVLQIVDVTQKIENVRQIIVIL